MPAPIRYVQDSPNFPDTADVVVIGAGIAGAAATWYLAKQGLKVVLIEKGLVGAEQSSRNWGWCRQQNRDERELPLVIEALRGWEQLSLDTGEELGFRRSGLVYATRNEADIAAWDAWGQMAKEYGVRSDILNAQQAKALTPGSTTNWLGGVSAPDDGAAEPRLAAPGIVIGAQKKGGAGLSAMCRARAGYRGRTCEWCRYGTRPDQNPPRDLCGWCLDIHVLPPARHRSAVGECDWHRLSHAAH